MIDEEVVWGSPAQQSGIGRLLTSAGGDASKLVNVARGVPDAGQQIAGGGYICGVAPRRAVVIAHYARRTTPSNVALLDSAHLTLLSVILVVLLLA